MSCGSEKIPDPVNRVSSPKGNESSHTTITISQDSSPKENLPSDVVKSAHTLISVTRVRDNVLKWYNLVPSLKPVILGTGEDQSPQFPDFPKFNFVRENTVDVFPETCEKILSVIEELKIYFSSKFNTIRTSINYYTQFEFVDREEEERVLGLRWFYYFEALRALKCKLWDRISNYPKTQDFLDEVYEFFIHILSEMLDFAKEPRKGFVHHFLSLFPVCKSAREATKMLATWYFVSQIWGFIVFGYPSMVFYFIVSFIYMTTFEYNNLNKMNYLIFVGLLITIIFKSPFPLVTVLLFFCTYNEQRVLNFLNRGIPFFQIYFGLAEFIYYIQIIGTPVYMRILPLISHFVFYFVGGDRAIDLHVGYNMCALMGAYIYFKLNVVSMLFFSSSVVAPLFLPFLTFLMTFLNSVNPVRQYNALIKHTADQFSDEIKNNFEPEIIRLFKYYKTSVIHNLYTLRWSYRDSFFSNSFTGGSSLSVFVNYMGNVGSNEIMCLVKHVVFLLHHLSLCTTKTNYLAVVADFVDKVISMYGLNYKDMYDMVLNYFNTCLSFTLQGPNVFMQLRSVIRTTMSTLNSKAIKTLSDIMIFLTMAPMLKSRGLNIDIAKYDKYTKKNFSERVSREGEVGLFMQVAEGFVDVLESGYMFLCGDRSLQDFFHCGTSYGQWFDAYVEINLEKDLLTADYDPTKPVPVVLSKYNLKVQKFIDDGKLILAKATSSGDKLCKDISKMLLEVNNIRKNVVKLMSANRSRMTPLGLLVYGEPNCGKSRVIDIIKRAYMDHQNMTTEELNALTFNHNSADEYFTNLTSAHKVFIEDDICAVNPKSGKQDASLDTILNLISSLPYFPNMAAIEDKGTVYANPDIVIATTNKKDLNAHMWFDNASAFLRRFPLVILPQVHKKFVYKENNDTTNSLNTALLVDYDEAIDGPLIKYDVDRPRLLPGTMAMVKYDHIAQGLTPLELYRFLVANIDAHIKSQEKYIQDNNKILNCPRCEHCNVPLVFCKCASLQSGAQRSDFIKLGSRVSNYTTRLYGFGGIIAALTSAIFLMKCFKTSSISEEEPDIEALELLASEVPNSEWKPPEVVMDSPISIKGAPQFAHFKEAILRNTYVGKDKEGSNFTFFAISSHVLITTYHSLSGLEKDGVSVNLILTTLSTKKAKFQRGSHVTLSKHNVKRFGDRDIAVCYLPSLVPAKDLKKHFVDTIDGLKSHKVYCPLVDKPNNIITHDTRFIEFGGGSKLGVVTTSRTGKIGDCGAPYAIIHKGLTKLVGIHVGSSINEGYFLPITKEEAIKMEKLAEGAAILPLFSQGEDSISSYGAYERAELHFKASTRNLTGFGYHVGSIKGYPRSRAKGSVTTTSIKDKVDRAFDEAKIKRRPYIQPVMKPAFYETDEGPKYVDPYIDTMQAVTDPKIGLPTDVSTHILESYKRYLDKLKFSDLEPLNQHEMVNGINGSQFINRIKVDTSAGYPFNRPKAEFLEPNYSHPNDPDAFMFKKDILNEVNRIKQCYLRRERYNPIFNATLKDEPLKTSKQFKTRVFSTCPVAFNLLVRKYFLPIMDFIQKRHFRFNSSVGVNCRSRSWKLFSSYLRHKKNMIAGDYEKFDKRVDAVTMLLAFAMIIEVARRCGYSNEDLLIMSGLAYDIIYCNVNIDGNVFVVNAMNPSGNSVTVLINNFINMVYTAFAFCVLYFIDLFWDIPKLFYGDDNVLSIPPEFPKYTHTHIQETLAKIGIKYTMADKTSQSIPYINIEEVDFLKRKFVTDGESVLAPLDIYSIYKSLAYRTRLADNVTELQRDFDALTNAKIEAIMHKSTDSGKLFKVLHTLQEDLVAETGVDLHVLAEDEIIDTYYDYL